MNIRKQYELYCWAERVFKYDNDNFYAITYGACNKLIELIGHRHEMTDYHYHMAMANKRLRGALQRYKHRTEHSLEEVYGGWRNIDMTHHITRARQIRKETRRDIA